MSQMVELALAQFLSFMGGVPVANLPASAKVGTVAYASNGRKSGEGAGSGTGVMVYFSNGLWRVFSTDAQVQS